MRKKITCAVIADDCIPTSMLIRFTLASMGVNTIFEAKNGHECLDVLTKCKETCSKSCDVSQLVVIMDWQMPDMDGIQCTEAIRRGDRGVDTETAVILLTADKEGIEEMKDLPDIDYLMFKPFTIEKLHKAFNALRHLPVAHRHPKK